MGLLILSLFDICCFRFATEGKCEDELAGHEMALERIQEFSDLIYGKKRSVQIHGAVVSLLVINYLLGRERVQYLEQLGEALQAVERHSNLIGKKISSDKVANAVPPPFVLRTLSQKAKDSLLSLYLFTELPMDLDALEALCEI
ncbi:hypothetical protein LAU_0116 [Lausannevirus]|uniref:Uncharacterized protein n=2 Tax=Lausannevirus TaxID=999883 RepID=A0A0N7G2D2_9VIRU|nr:hypothetical protein LAU_0116 [Lausannevirus]AEA06968.1 hypothetical protein LAU_0116 [Lausannevirus]ALH06800.1 hypothetical protein PMV_102 [Port-miou virus]